MLKSVSVLKRISAPVVGAFGMASAAGAEPIVIRMPALSPTMEEGSIVRWGAKEGDEVGIDDVLYEIQTDKATLEQGPPEDGTLVKILVEEGTVVPVGQMIAVMVEEGEDPSSVTIPTEEAPPSNAPPTTTTTTPATSSSSQTSNTSTSTTSSASSSGGPVDTSGVTFPSVARLMRLYGVTADQIDATGPKGRILKGDVLSFIQGRSPVITASSPVTSPLPASSSSSSTPASSAARPAKPAPPTAVASGNLYAPVDEWTGEPQYHDEANTQMRRVIAKRLGESKFGSPHEYVTAKVDISDLLRLRKMVNDDRVAQDLKPVSVNDFVIRASALTLANHPTINGPSESVDVSVAVATPTGLITPIVKEASNKRLGQISSDVRTLAAKAKEGTLAPDEFMGGTFSISNLGMMGVSHFTAIINPPQRAILAVGSAAPKLVLDPTTGRPSSKPLLHMTMSMDASIVSDDDAAAFLADLTALLASPKKLLL